MIRYDLIVDAVITQGEIVRMTLTDVRRLKQLETRNSIKLL